ncbi:hypothetical protein [Sphingobacterium sp.]|uniref:hypothetical protein n=1 Tax=Sphingobacterium sp. TaxID=341027 RepID=UPI0028A95426|nr:hypothetical protein [Sphingobacterium sp.]
MQGALVVNIQSITYEPLLSNVKLLSLKFLRLISFGFKAISLLLFYLKFNSMREYPNKETSDKMIKIGTNVSILFFPKRNGSIPPKKMIFTTGKNEG